MAETTVGTTTENALYSYLASGARTTTQVSDDLNIEGFVKALHLVVDVTNAGTGSITAKVEAKDANGVYYTLLTGAAITTISTNVYRIGPSLTAAANAVANDFVPPIVRVTITANNANSMTYSVSLAAIH